MEHSGSPSRKRKVAAQDRHETIAQAPPVHHPRHAQRRSAYKVIAWHTVQEVADHFKISERQVRRWIADGYLKAKHFGRSVRISSQELNRVESTQE